MKRCPQSSRVETDDALVYCRVDGAALNSDSPSAFNETETRILPHTTDVNAVSSASGNDRELHNSLWQICDVTTDK